MKTKGEKILLILFLIIIIGGLLLINTPILIKIPENPQVEKCVDSTIIQDYESNIYLLEQYNDYLIETIEEKDSLLNVCINLLYEYKNILNNGYIFK